MFRVKSEAVIQRTVDEVWSFVADPHNEPKWHTDILAIEPASDPAAGIADGWTLGSEWLVTVNFMGRRQYLVEITEFEPSRVLEFTTRTGSIKPISAYRFEGVEDATRFRREVEISLTGPFRILEPLMRLNARRRNATFVHNLKELIEA